jgi:hypothetical protein
MTALSAANNEEHTPLSKTELRVTKVDICVSCFNIFNSIFYMFQGYKELIYT